MKVLILTTAALLLCAAAPAAAQGSADQEPSESVVVTGQQIEEAVQAFVSDLSVEAGSEDQLARWNQRVCPGVAGLRASQAQAVADHIAVHALEVGLDVGEPGCRPNILVLVTSDSDRVARYILAYHSAVLARFTDAAVNTRGRAALDDFVSTPRPVRWWHISLTASADGMDARSNGIERLSGDLGPGEGVRSPGGASRINRATRQDLASAIIIVDGRRAAAVPVGQLADYVAMVALAQLDPDADTSAYPTILNLFAPERVGGLGPTGLTDWDRAYLEGLYSAPQARSQASQEREIERRMTQGAGAPPVQ